MTSSKPSEWDLTNSPLTLHICSSILYRLKTHINFPTYFIEIHFFSLFQPPMIPIYPMVNKDLTFIHLGNETKVDFLGKKASKDEGLINFEKLRMVAKEVRNLMNMCSGNFLFVLNGLFRGCK